MTKDQYGDMRRNIGAAKDAAHALQGAFAAEISTFDGDDWCMSDEAAYHADCAMMHAVLGRVIATLEEAYRLAAALHIFNEGAGGGL